MSTATPRLGLVKPAAGEQYQRSVMNNNSDIIDAYALDRDKLPKGLLNYSANVGNPVGIVATLVVISNFPSVTFVGGRKYRVGWTAEYDMSNPDTKGEISIQKCAVADSAGAITGLTIYNRHTIEAKDANASTFFYHSFIHTPSVTEIVQVKFLVQRVAGTGDIDFSGSALGRPIEAFVEDIGAQF